MQQRFKQGIRADADFGDVVSDQDLDTINWAIKDIKATGSVSEEVKSALINNMTPTMKSIFDSKAKRNGITLQFSTGHRGDVIDVRVGAIKSTPTPMGTPSVTQPKNTPPAETKATPAPTGTPTASGTTPKVTGPNGEKDCVYTGYDIDGGKKRKTYSCKGEQNSPSLFRKMYDPRFTLDWAADKVFGEDDSRKVYGEWEDCPDGVCSESATKTASTPSASKPTAASKTSTPTVTATTSATSVPGTSGKDDSFMRNPYLGKIPVGSGASNADTYAGLISWPEWTQPHRIGTATLDPSWDFSTQEGTQFILDQYARSQLGDPYMSRDLAPFAWAYSAMYPYMHVGQTADKATMTAGFDPAMQQVLDTGNRMDTDGAWDAVLNPEFYANSTYTDSAGNTYQYDANPEKQYDSIMEALGALVVYMGQDTAQYLAQRVDSEYNNWRALWAQDHSIGDFVTWLNARGATHWIGN